MRGDGRSDFGALAQQPERLDVVPAQCVTPRDVAQRLESRNSRFGRPRQRLDPMSQPLDDRVEVQFSDENRKIVEDMCFDPHVAFAKAFDVGQRPLQVVGLTEVVTGAGGDCAE